MPLRSAPIRSSLRICFAEGVLATPLGVLAAPGNFVLAALFAAWGYPPHIYGIALSLRFWCNVLQVGISPIVARYWSSRTLYLSMVGLNTGLWGVLGLLLLGTESPGEHAPLLLGVLLAAHFTGAFAGVAWLSWVREWIPAVLHPGFFALRIRWSDVVAVAFSAVAGIVLDRGHSPASSITVILLTAVALRFAGWIWSFRITANQRAGIRQPPVMSVQIATVITDRRFMCFIVFSMVVALGLATFAPFAPLFMLQQLGHTALDLGYCAALSTLSGVLTLRWWGRLASHAGYVKQLTVALALWVFANLGWCFATSQTPWLVYITWGLGGAAMAGIILGKLNLLLKWTPQAASTAGLGVHTAVTSLAAAVGPVIAGTWLHTAGDIPSIEVYHRFFCVQPMVLCLGMVLLWWRTDLWPVSYTLGRKRSAQEKEALRH